MLGLKLSNYSIRQTSWGRRVKLKDVWPAQSNFYVERGMENGKLHESVCTQKGV